jgi:hypothetical protein
MAKVTVHNTPPETPTQAVVKAANQITQVTDAKGRNLGLRRIPFLEEFRIIETVGAERAANQVYMSMLNPVLCIAEIDGEKIDIPRTHPQIEALIQRAGEEGFLAAFEWITAQANPGTKESEDKVKN